MKKKRRAAAPHPTPRHTWALMPRLPCSQLLLPSVLVGKNKKGIVRANVAAFGAPLWPLAFAPLHAMMGLLWRSGGVDEPPGPGGAGPLCRCRRSWRLW